MDGAAAQVRREGGLSTIDMDSNGMRFRPLSPVDRNALQTLHERWFPVNYPKSFYDTAATLHSPYLSVACVGPSNELLGMVVAKLVSPFECDKEDAGVVRTLMASRSPGDPEPKLLYVMTLGVVETHRHRGIATALFTQLVKNPEIRYDAIFLHVLRSNLPALAFYQKLGFKRLELLVGYYAINGARHDAYSCFYQVPPLKRDPRQIFKDLGNVIMDCLFSPWAK